MIMIGVYNRENPRDCYTPETLETVSHLGSNVSDTSETPETPATLIHLSLLLSCALS